MPGPSGGQASSMIWQPSAATMAPMHGNDLRYPLVIANRVPLFYRAFTSLWLGGVALISWKAWSSHPPEATRYWPWILSGFWIVGLVAMRWAFSIEIGRLIVAGPGDAAIVRGPIFRRRRHVLTRLAPRLVDTVDGEGDPYHQLVVEAPGGPLIVREGHHRGRLVELGTRIEAAFQPGSS
jgi:hypothetical protein